MPTQTPQSDAIMSADKSANIKKKCFIEINQLFKTSLWNVCKIFVKGNESSLKVCIETKHKDKAKSDIDTQYKDKANSDTNSKNKCQRVFVL